MECDPPLFTPDDIAPAIYRPGMYVGERGDQKLHLWQAKAVATYLNHKTDDHRRLNKQRNAPMKQTRIFALAFAGALVVAIVFIYISMASSLGTDVSTWRVQMRAGDVLAAKKTRDACRTLLTKP